MPKRIPTMSIVMFVAGKRVALKPNKPVELSAAQIKEIEAVAGKNALRLPMNEETADVQILPTAGIVNQDDSAANPDASVPAPAGAATSPVKPGKSGKTGPAPVDAADTEL